MISFLFFLVGLVNTVEAIDTVAVNLTQYEGRWYQTYADKFVVSTFERNAVCVTADYTLQDDGTVAVLNSQRSGDVDGPVENVTATAYTTDQPGQLKVVFDGQLPFGAPYWVVALGPVVNDSYDWAIVTDNRQEALFVLARSVETFETEYDAQVLSLLEDLGFIGPLNSPIKTTQDGCTYPDPPSQISAETKVQFGADSQCKEVNAVVDFDLDAYARHTWYIQQQQLTSYQTADDLFCVTATYDDTDAIQSYSVPRFDGKVVGVYNYANKGAVNGPTEGSANDTVLCARLLNESAPGALSVAPCFLPNRFAGDYWVVAFSPDYSWAIVSGGQPTVGPYPDGGCTTETTTTNGSGLWIFSSTPIMAEEDLEKARQTLVDLGYTTSELLTVPQDGCSYAGAYIK